MNCVITDIIIDIPDTGFGEKSGILKAPAVQGKKCCNPAGKML